MPPTQHVCLTSEDGTPLVVLGVRVFSHVNDVEACNHLKRLMSMGHYNKGTPARMGSHSSVVGGVFVFVRALGHRPKYKKVIDVQQAEVHEHRHLMPVVVWQQVWGVVNELQSKKEVNHASFNIHLRSMWFHSIRNQPKAPTDITPVSQEGLQSEATIALFVNPYSDAITDMLPLHHMEEL